MQGVAQWCMPTIPKLQRLNWDLLELKASLGLHIDKSSRRKKEHIGWMAHTTNLSGSWSL